MMLQRPIRSRIVWDEVRGRWSGLRGLGGSVPLPQWCDQASAWNPLAYLLCLPHDVAHVYDNAGQAAGAAYSDVRYGTVGGQPTIPMPAPPPPDVSITTDASAASDPNAVYAGTLNGQAYYAVPQTASENMAAFKASVNNYFNQVGNAANAANCASIFSYFDSTCPNFTTTLLVGAALAAFLLLGGGRR